MRVGIVAAGMAALAALAPPALAQPKPDLIVSELSGGSSTVAAGSTLSISDTVENVGRVKAGKSTTRFYLSPDQAKGGGDTRLEGVRKVGKLGADETSAGPSEPELPLTTPQGDLYVLACADDRKDVRERREGNNCLASDSPTTIELPADCTDRLVALGVDFVEGPGAPGVNDPVTVNPPINEITYDDPGQGNDMFMDCTLALALHAMGEEMTERGLSHVEHFGIYNYRCIGPGTPPDCQGSLLSRHAYADAFDIRELRAPGGETYNVEDDWVIDGGPEGTCAAPTSNPKDALLQSFVCALHAEGIFHILLTPNYNADHRNHFHLDLTPDASFID